MAIYPKYGLSICAGVGAFDLGLQLAFPESVTVCFVEREISSCEILVARMEEGSLPSAPVYSDLLTFDGKPWRGLIDFCAAGLPCQPYSVAGKQLGHDDDRAIWPAFIRVVGEVQPTVVFLENVPAFLRYFRPIGSELQRMGYVIEEPLLLTAAECGASHRRERFFAMAYRPSRGLRELWQPSRSDRLADWSNQNVADASRDERDGPARKAGSGWGVRKTSDRVADTGNGLLSEPGRRPEGRDGAGPADTVLGVLRCAGRNRTDGNVADAECSSPQREHEPGGAGCRRSEPARDLAAVANSDNMGASGESGIVRSAETERSSEGPERQRDGSATGHDCVFLADTECTEWRENVEHDGHPGRRIETSGGSGGAGDDLGDSNLAGLEGWQQCGLRCADERIIGTTGYTELPLFAPGPGETDQWRRILAEYPELSPALSEEEIERVIHTLADGPAATLASSRTDGLRMCGNSIVSICCAKAVTLLARRIRE